MASLYLRTITKKDKNGKIKAVYKKYYTKIKINGVWVSQTTGERAKSNALPILIERQNKPLKGNKIDLKTLQNEVLTMVKLCNNQFSLYNYTNTFRKLIELIGNKPINEVTKNNILSYIAMRQKSITVRNAPPSNGTINVELACLKRAFNIAIENDWLDKNPVKGVKKQAVNKTRRAYTAQETELLLNALYSLKNKSKYYAMLICFNCGLRRSEVCNLKWSQIDMVNWKIKLTNKIDKKEEWVGFNQIVYNTLLILQQNKIKGIGNSIYGASPISPDGLYQTVKLQLIKLGIKEGLCVHSARHTAVTKWVNTYGIHIGQIFARHRSIQVTSGYYHGSDNELLKLAKDVQVT